MPANADPLAAKFGHTQILATQPETHVHHHPLQNGGRRLPLRHCCIVVLLSAHSSLHAGRQLGGTAVPRHQDRHLQGGTDVG